MPLRMYALHDPGVSSGVIGVTTTQGPWWNSPATATYGRLSLDKNDSTINGASSLTGVSPSGSHANAKTYLGSWAYQLPTDMVLSGTVDLAFPVSTFGGIGWDVHWVLHAWVASAPGTGPLIRGTLINGYSEPTGATNRLDGSPGNAHQLIAPVNTTGFQCRAGDWVIFEIGAVQINSTLGDTNIGTTWGTKTLGGSIAVDYVAGDLSAYPDVAGAAWIEFTMVPTPIPDDNSTPCNPTCGGGGTTTPPPDQTPLQPWTEMCVGGGLVPTAFAPAAAEVW